MFTSPYNETLSVGGLNFKNTISYSHDTALLADMVIPAATSGVLSVRGGDDSGTIVFTDDSHNLIAGDRFDLYFTNADGSAGVQIGCIVSAVTGTGDTDVAFSGGVSTGVADILPVVDSVVKSCEATYEVYELDAYTVQAFGVGSIRHAVVSIVTGNPTDEPYPIVVNNSAYIWHTLNGLAFPFAGLVILGFYVSQGHTADSDVRVGAAIA